MAAMAPWVLSTIHRRKGAGPVSLLRFMPRTAGRQDENGSAPAGGHRAPAQTPMRIAKPGERPPSRRPPGVPDQVIERFDAYMNAVQGGPYRG